MRMHEKKIHIDPETEVSSIWISPEGYSPATSPTLILAPGAGSNIQNPFLSFIHEMLAKRGVMTVKFNFPYMEAGRKSPDPAARLAHTWRAVMQRVRDDAKPAKLFLGGK